MSGQSILISGLNLILNKDSEGDDDMNKPTLRTGGKTPDPLTVWINMDDSFRAKALMEIAIFSKLIKARWLVKFCVNRIAKKHMNFKYK